MKLLFLGTGGAAPLPVPLCTCPACQQARQLGDKFQRFSPALFLEQENLLFDTPPGISQQVEKYGVKKIQNVFYTHWHPDHTFGMRLFEYLKATLPQEPNKKPLDVFTPQEVYQDFKKYFQNIFYYRFKKWIKIKKINDREKITFPSLEVTPINFRRIDRERYGYLIKEKQRKIFYAPCSIYNMKTDQSLKNLDLLILELGWFGPTERTRQNYPNSIYTDHISFEENIALAEKLAPKKTIFTHISECWFRVKNYPQDYLYQKIKEYPHLNLEVAYDGLEIII